MRASRGERKYCFSPSMRVIAGLLCGALLTSCGSSAPPRPEKIFAEDLIGIKSEDFPCEKYTKEAEGASEIQLGYLGGGTFGENESCLNTYFEDPRLTKVRVHICSGPAVTNNRSHEGECLHGLRWGENARMLERIRLWTEQEFTYLASRDRPDVKYYISPVLEHKLQPSIFDAVAMMVLDLARQYGLTVTIVDNPLVPRPSRYLQEVHARNPIDPYFIYSDDGNFGASKIEEYPYAEMALGWNASHNGLCTDGRPWVLPTERECW